MRHNTLCVPASNDSLAFITEKKVIKWYRVVNKICDAKAFDQARKNQTLVFV